MQGRKGLRCSKTGLHPPCVIVTVLTAVKPIFHYQQPSLPRLCSIVSITPLMANKIFNVIANLTLTNSLVRRKRNSKINNHSYYMHTYLHVQHEPTTRRTKAIMLHDDRELIGKHHGYRHGTTAIRNTEQTCTITIISVS